MRKILKVKLRTLRFISLTLITVGALIVSLPFLPDIKYRLFHKNDVPYSSRLNNYYPSTNRGSAPAPKDNRLVIPEIGVNERVLEGSNISVLNHNGVWRLPYTSNNPEKSNMVIIGHRYMYNNPFGTFYLLDKLKPGVKFDLYWKSHEHTYTVDSVKVVPSSDIRVEAPTQKPQLTLYTCTPLWSAKDRLVVVASEI